MSVDIIHSFIDGSVRRIEPNSSFVYDLAYKPDLTFAAGTSRELAAGLVH
jgi:hypothetical protein